MSKPAGTGPPPVAAAAPIRRRGWPRALLLVLGLLLVGVLLAPPLIGLTLHSRYDNLLQELAAAGYPVREHRWQGGWFGAEALTLIGPPAGATGPGLRIVTRFRHGPRPADLRRWPPPLASGQARITVSDAGRPLPPLRVDLRLGLDGTTGLHLVMPDVTYSGAGGQWQLVGLRAELRLADAGRSITGNGGLEELRITDAAGQMLVLRGLRWQLGLAAGLADLPAGDLLLTLGGLRADLTQGPGTLPGVFTAGGVRLGMALTNAPAGGTDGMARRLELGAALELDRLRVERIQLGRARWVLTLTGLDPAVLTAWWRGWQDINGAGLSPSLRGLAQGEWSLRLLPALLAAEPRLKADPITLTTADGPVDARLELGVAPGRLVGSPLAAGFWLARLHGEGRLSLPPALVRRWLLERQRTRALREWGLLRTGQGADPELPDLAEEGSGLPPALEAELAAAADGALAGLVREGWLVPAAGRLSARVRIGDGLLTINGRTLTLLGQ